MEPSSPAYGPSSAALTRIAHVALQLDTGGLERMLVSFAKRADRARFELRFISLTTRGRMADEIEDCGWGVTALNARSGLRPGLVLRLANLFRSEEIDVVHTHNTKPLIYAGPAGRWAGVAGVVHTRHGQRRGATPRQNRMFRFASRCAHELVCVSTESAARCIAEGVEARRVRTIHNGIDLSGGPGSSFNAAGPAVFVGRLSPEKDVATLLRATAMVVRERPGFQMRVAGDGVCVAPLKALAFELGLESSVEFLGQVASAREVLEGASMVVLPSLSEGLPISVLEGMAAGLPVIATRVGGTPEVVLDGQTGLLVEAGDAPAMAAAITRLLDDPALAHRLGQEGRRRVIERFDDRTMLARYEALYQTVVANTRKAAA